MAKFNMQLEKNPMPSQDPEVRKRNFEEVALGYSEETAVNEAMRCLECKNPKCVSGCPVGINIPGFIKKIKERDYDGAYDVISESSLLPAICGRVCPQESQCEKHCVRGVKGDPVGIGRLERFAADLRMSKNVPVSKPETKNGKKIAVVGSGPAGLSCAGVLAKKGYDVTIFEALHVAGGVLMYGIPQFRLPKEIVQREISNLKELGVDIETNHIIGKTYTIDDLKSDGYDAIFIGSGAGLPRFMNIPGENLMGVYSANEFLTRINLMKAYKDDSHTPVMKGRNVAVVGGGNVAMDAARSAMRLGAENVYIIYRRSEAELPARAEEVEHAKEEGIIFKTLNNPVEILGDENGFVKGVKCIEMELGEPDESGRRRPVAKPGSEHVVDMDCVVMSIGTTPNPLIASTTKGLEVNKRGCIVVDEDTCHTSRDTVYAGGDAVSGAATVILAMGAGKKAAESIDKLLSK
ncbi:MAG: NADPH-dependent glutamate synthase [Oscillospiraceae bacterium]|nr:NADPH-dependent glutamate synthase [Oscillospiraceae bacterium]MDD6085182.1 NADPH-dependent glutamate synthase [Oscillospiraceae bacterium]MDY3256729.1 NADPH-dependent glutamate synthase [Ruminococcus callidus]